MPFYRFHLAVPLPPAVVRERLASLVRPEPSSEEYFSRIWNSTEPQGPPFIGHVAQDSFTLRRDIRGRNSFLPRIKGQITPTLAGTAVDVTMFLHPFTAVFMTFWLSLVAFAALHALGGVVMFLAGVAMTLGFFSRGFQGETDFYLQSLASRQGPFYISQPREIRWPVLTLLGNHGSAPAGRRSWPLARTASSRCQPSQSSLLSATKRWTSSLVVRPHSELKPL